MTIHEHDRVSAGRDGESPKPLGSHALVDRLSAGEPYAVAFGGQGGAWLENLEELVSSAGIENELAGLVAEAEVMLEPIANELVVVRPIGFEPLRWVRAHAAGEELPSAKHLTSAAISMPGILLTQLAAVRALTRQGMDFAATPPVASTGHSQGVLAVESLRTRGARDVELMVLIQLIGSACTLIARRRGIVGARRSATDGVGHQRRPRAGRANCSTSSRPTFAPCRRRRCRSATAAARR